MASFEKYTDNSVIGQIGHDTRCLTHDNPDIDEEKSKDNYCLTPYIHIPKSEQYGRRNEIRKLEIEGYKKALSRCYIYNKDRQYTAIGSVITLPADVAPEDAEVFFTTFRNYCSERIGPCIAAHVHVDEKGERPHCHVINLATVEIDHKAIEEKIARTEARGSKSRVPLALREKREDGSYKYERKIACDEIVGGVRGRISQKQEQGFYETFHKDLQQYLKDHGVPGTVVGKDTESSRVNLTVAQLKEYTERTGKIISPEILKDMTVDKVINALEKERSRERDAWGRERDDMTWER